MDNKGFTLIEITIVMIIIAILAGIALPRYNKTVENARTAEAKHMLGAIREAELRYAEEYDVYTTASSNLDINITTGKFFTFSIGGTATFNDGVDSIIALGTRNSDACCGGYTAGYIINIYESGNLTSVGGGPPM